MNVLVATQYLPLVGEITQNNPNRKAPAREILGKDKRIIQTHPNDRILICGDILGGSVVLSVQEEKQEMRLSRTLQILAGAISEQEIVLGRDIYYIHKAEALWNLITAYFF
jgi:DNA topoisomerase VI subunit A